MKPVLRVAATVFLPALCACASGSRVREPISIEFGQDRYLSDRYLADTPGARCGHPVFAPGGVEARAPLPDGTWFRVFAIGDGPDALRTIVLERGITGQEARLTMRLDAEEGIVRLDDTGRRDAWGIYHPWADWLRDLGRRVQALDCASVG
jgi:hypothetical protein